MVVFVRDACVGAGSFFQRAFSAHRQIFLAAGGMLGLMHGHALAFTALFVQSFSASGWPLMHRAAADFSAAYKEAKQNQAPRETAKYAAAVAPLRRELVDLAAQLASLRRQGEGTEAEQRAVLSEMRRVRAKLESVPPSRRAAPVLVAACEPAIIRDVALGIWSGVTVAFTGACSSAARTIGIGISLGEVVSRAANALLAALEPALRRALSALPPEAVMLTYL